MRRAFAILLLAVLGFPLISPALIAKSKNTLPECCKRDGAHHCSSMGTFDDMERPSGAVMEEARAKCPQFPKGGAAPAAGTLCDLSPSGFYFAPLASHPAATEQTEARYRISFSRAGQKRGPPALSV